MSMKQSDITVIAKGMVDYSPSEGVRAIEKILLETSGDYISDLTQIAAIALRSLDIVASGKSKAKAKARVRKPDRDTDTGRFR